eukprot:4640477-Amphidinium_carterae.1
MSDDDDDDDDDGDGAGAGVVAKGRGTQLQKEEFALQLEGILVLLLEVNLASAAPRGSALYPCCLRAVTLGVSGGALGASKLAASLMQLEEEEEEALNGPNIRRRGHGRRRRRGKLKFTQLPVLLSCLEFLRYLR